MRVSCIDEKGGHETAYDIILYVLNRPFKKEEDSSCGNVKKRDVAQNTGAAFQEPGRLLEIKQGKYHEKIFYCADTVCVEL